MIYHSDEKIDVWQKNVMMLDLEDDMGYLYVTRNTYDQAVILNDRFGHSSSALRERLGGPDTQNDIVEFMSSILPEPISILAPFYHLIGSEVEFDVDNVHQIIGALSYMSMNIDFNGFLKVPHEVRASLSYTKSILFDFLPSYEDFTFKLSTTSGHIYMKEENEVDDTNDDSRSRRKNFHLEDDVKNEDDYESVIEDINKLWEDLPIPDPVMPTVEESTSTAHTVEEQSAGDSFNKKESEAAAYEAIVGNFV